MHHDLKQLIDRHPDLCGLPEEVALERLVRLAEAELTRLRGHAND